MVSTLSLAIFIVISTPFVWASNDTTVSLGLFTDIECEAPSTVQPNVSLPLDVCAITPGLGSVTLPVVPCSEGSVQVWSFSGSACAKEDMIFVLGNNCMGRATEGTYGAIMLNCDETSPGVAASTTTLDLGVALAATATSSTTPASSSSNSSKNSIKNESSWWERISLGARIGIVIAGVAAGILIIFGIWDRIRRNQAPARRNVVEGHFETDLEVRPVRRFVRH